MAIPEPLESNENQKHNKSHCDHADGSKSDPERNNYNQLQPSTSLYRPALIPQLDLFMPDKVYTIGLDLITA